MQREDAPPKTVELWIRSFTPTAVGPHYERAFERLEYLATRSGIRTTTVGVWGKEVERSDERASVPQLRTIQRRLQSVEAWSNEVGRDIEPFFRYSRVESTITDDRYEVWRPPSLAVLEFRGDELIHVAPSRDGDRIVEPITRLDELGRGDAIDPVLTFDDDDTPIKPTGSSERVEESQHGKSVRGVRSMPRGPDPR